MNIKSMLKTALGGVVSSSVAVGLMLGSFNLGVEAAGTGPKQFIDAAKLNNVNTKYGLYKNKFLEDRVVQKVYFGKNEKYYTNNNIAYEMIDESKYNQLLADTSYAHEENNGITTFYKGLGEGGYFCLHLRHEYRSTAKLVYCRV